MPRHEMTGQPWMIGTAGDAGYMAGFLLRLHDTTATAEDVEHALAVLYAIDERRIARPRFADWSEAWPIVRAARERDGLPIGTGEPYLSPKGRTRGKRRR